MSTTDAGAGEVLVIDDERGPRESLRMLLKIRHRVRCADSVDEGLRLLREAPADVVVMDIRMPGKSGIQGLADVRALDPDVSIVMLTGYGALETAQEAIRLGATDYIKKPFDTVEMENLIARYIQRTQTVRRQRKTERELQELTDRLNRQMATQHDLARLGMASSELVHDLRNPLTAVLGYVELLADQLRRRREAPAGSPEAGEETLSYLDAIEANVRRCRELSETWQSLTRRPAEQQRFFSPADLLRDVEQGVGPRTETDQVRLAFERAPGAERQRIHGDRLQLFRALMNVTQNALQAVASRGAAGGQVRVSCAPAGAQVVFTVADNGPGISAEKLKHIFEPFFTTKAPGRGTGLGLFIAQKVVEDHGGSIRMESEEGNGARVIIALPAGVADGG